MWEVVWSQRSRRDLRALDPVVAIRVIRAVDLLASTIVSFSTLSDAMRLANSQAK